MKKSAIIIAVLTVLTMNLYCLQAQERIGIAVYQDVNLALGGDSEHGNSGFTTDIRTRIKLEAMERKYGYIVLGIVFEYADLNSTELGVFYRYGAELGYVFNTPINNLKISPTIGYGILSRQYDYARRSWEFSGEVFYNITKNISVNALGTFMERTDLPNKSFGFNGYIGIQYSFSTKL